MPCENEIWFSGLLNYKGIPEVNAERVCGERCQPIAQSTPKLAQVQVPRFPGINFAYSMPVFLLHSCVFDTGHIYLPKKKRIEMKIHILGNN